MDISESSLWHEIEEVKQNGVNPVHFQWDCLLIIEDEHVSPVKVLSVEATREYNTQYADEMIIKILLDTGVYNRLVFPNRDNFKVALFKDPIGEIDTSVDYEEETKMRIYQGALLRAKSDALEGSEGAPVSVDGMASLDEYYIQLIDPAAEQIRMMTTGGIYRDMTTTEVLHGVMSMISGSLDLDKASAIYGVDMVPGNNQIRRDHVVIPHGTPVVDLARYVQEEAGGIYGSGIGQYLQDGIWYIYPEYDIVRFDATTRSLTILNVPDNRLPKIERSYVFDGERVIVIATGTTKHMDVSEELQLNLGNAVQYVVGSNIMDGFCGVSKNKAVVNRDNNMRKITLGKRRTGLNNTPMSPRRITDNKFRETSELAKRIGTYIQLEWQNAQPDLVYPGMPVRYVYVDGDSLGTVYGTVVGADYLSYQQGTGITSGRHITDMVLTLFVEQLKAK